MAMRCTKPRQLAESAAWRILERVARGQDAPAATRDCLPDLTVGELCRRWSAHAKEYFRDNPQGVVDATADVRLFGSMFGEALVADLSHRDMLDHREALIDRGYARTTVNRRIRAVNQMMAWALDEALVSAVVKAELTQVRALKPRRSRAKEPVPVLAVPDAILEATLPALPPSVADLLRVMRLTGMRPGEACGLDWALIERRESDGVWIYRPAEHKNVWHNHPRAIVIGPKAQGVLSRHATTPGRRIFSPAEATLERYATMRAARKSPVQPSQLNRSKPDALRRPGAAWRPAALAKCVRAACLAAGVPPWHANQLRHACATEIRRHIGIDAARAVLGHNLGLRITDRYSFEAAEDEIIRLATPAMLAMG